LSIIDIDVIELNGQDYILLTDISSRLVIFRYTESNTIEDIMIVPVEGIPSNFATSYSGTWLIANYRYVMECDFSQPSSTVSIIQRYELDPADNIVV
jgi:hypothetical protein